MVDQQLSAVAEQSSTAVSVPQTDPFCVKIASSREEFEQAFRLIQRAYVHAGLAKPNESDLRITEHQLRPSSTVFIAVLRSEVISTISLVPDSEIGLPIESAFSREIAQLRANGKQLAEVSCLADRRGHMGRRLRVLRELFRWMVQKARLNAIDQLVLAVHPRHTKFYQRYLACELIGDEVREFKTVLNEPAVALSLDFETIDRERPANYDLFFGESIPEAMLRQIGMSVQTRTHFAEAGKVQKPAEA